MCCLLPCRMMGSGLFRAQKTEAFSSGTLGRQLYNACCRDIRILVRVFHVVSRMTLICVIVISIDLSPAGSILATGSGDWQARICISHFLLFQ